MGIDEINEAAKAGEIGEDMTDADACAHLMVTAAIYCADMLHRSLPGADGSVYAWEAVWWRDSACSAEVVDTRDEAVKMARQHADAGVDTAYVIPLYRGEPVPIAVTRGEPVPSTTPTNATP